MNQNVSKTEKEGRIAPGTPEDLRMTIDNLNQFWSAKIKAMELYNKSGELVDSTANTRSVCHTDGTTDGD